MAGSLLGFLLALEPVDADRKDVLESLSFSLENIKFVSQLVAPLDNPLFEDFVLDHSMLDLFFLAQHKFIAVFFNALVKVFFQFLEAALLGQDLVFSPLGFLDAFLHLVDFLFQV